MNIDLVRLLMHDTSIILLTVTTSYFWTVNSEETYCNFICQDYNFNCHHASMRKLRCDLHAYNHINISEYIQTSIHQSIHPYIHASNYISIHIYIHIRVFKWKHFLQFLKLFFRTFISTQYR